jgi:erythromycin esterase-like protein
MQRHRTLQCAGLLLGIAAAAQAQDGVRPAVPRDAVAGILGAFSSHRLVALGEGQHWNEQGHAFRVALLRDLRFANTVNDIVVEFGSARYQDVMDRFIRGDVVSDDTLRQAWENTTQPNTVWDMPIYEAFFRAVRDVNAALPPERRLRVVLADPPIDWDTVRGKDDIVAWMDKRDSHAAAVVRREVLDRGRRALLIFGDGHLWRRDDPATLVALLERDAPGEVFTITTPTSADLAAIQRDVASWPAPRFATLAGTSLGAADFAPLYKLPPEQYRGVHFEQQFDAFIYLGAPATITLAHVSQAKCADRRYLDMRLRRMAMVPWGKDEVERLRKDCARHTP